MALGKSSKEKEIRDDKEIVKAAIKNMPIALKYASSRLKKELKPKEQKIN